MQVETTQISPNHPPHKVYARSKYLDLGVRDRIEFSYYSLLTCIHSQVKSKVKLFYSAPES